MLYIAITGHLKYVLTGLDLNPADQFGTIILFVHSNNIVSSCKNKRPGYTVTVNRHQQHKLERLMISGKIWFWLLQIQCVPPCRSPQSWPVPSLRTETQAPGVILSFCAYAPPLLSRVRPQTSSPSVWSTYQEQRLNSSPGIIEQLNEQGGHTKVTENEWAKRETGRGEKARRKNSHLY